MIRRACIVLLASGCLAGIVSCADAPPASANIVCGVAGFFSGAAGKVCNVATGPVGGVLKKLLGGSGSSGSSHLAAAAGVVAIGAAAALAADAAVKIVAKAIGDSTSPQLTSTWFSGTYWRVTAIAALLALPFLFAAAVQSLMRSDITLLIRAAFGYLPLAALVTAIAAPLTMLLLAASDEMSSIVSSAAPNGHHFLEKAALFTGLFATARRSPFLLIVVGALATLFAVAVWLELAVREASIYVIVLMLPLMFSAMVWPARRVWAMRAVEILVALILSKFVIVAVLSLGSGALGAGVVSAIAGIALLILAAFSPWMLLRLLPMAEMAGAATGSLSDGLRSHGGTGLKAIGNAAPISNWRESAGDWLHGTVAAMRGQAEDADALHVSPGGRYGGTGGTFGGASPGRGDPEGGSEPTDGGAPGGGGGPAGGGNGSGGTSPSGSGGETEPVPAGGTAATNGAKSEAGLASPAHARMWRAPDESHREIVLGPNEYPNPPLVFPLDDPDDPAGGEHQDPLPEPQPDPEDQVP